MKFKDYKYIRPDIEKIKSEFQKLIDDFQNAITSEEQVSMTYKVFNLKNDIDVMMTLASIRSGANIKDEYYDEENQYCENIQPIIQGYVTEFMKAFINSKFKAELAEKFGDHLFNLYKYQIYSYDDSILEDLQEENILCNQYSKLVASAKIEFMGEIRNLSQLQPFMQNSNRDIRKKAHEKYFGFYADNMEVIDDIYDKLVTLRTKMAKKLGYNNYTEMAYFKLSRDYNQDEAEKFRDAVHKYIVPLSNSFREKQKKMINVDNLKYYDLLLNFKNGNAKPKGDLAWQLEKTKKMYTELSKDTKEYIETILDCELHDLEGRQDKYVGAYCTWIPNYKVPYIYGNSNGTEADINTLTHEAGHGFQVYQALKNIDVPDYMFPAYDACEIHSMSMEFITWPWMKLFFEEDEMKYKYYHVSEGINFIPYSVCVDEFQHEIYNNPEFTPAQRRAKWRELEKKYMPYIDYEDNDFLENGGYWFKQSHIFSGPFYYLDYALAQICAYQYWIKCNENHEKGWNEYLNLCNFGGSEGLKKLLELGNLNSPFEKETLNDISKYIENFINEIDISIFI